MEILIWGTGEKGRRVRDFCDKKGLIAKAFIDNDETRLGYLDGLAVIAPDCISTVRRGMVFISGLRQARMKSMSRLGKLQIFQKKF